MRGAALFVPTKTSRGTSRNASRMCALGDPARAQLPLDHLLALGGKSLSWPVSWGPSPVGGDNPRAKGGVPGEGHGRAVHGLGAGELRALHGAAAVPPVRGGTGRASQGAAAAANPRNGGGHRRRHGRAGRGAPHAEIVATDLNQAMLDVAATRVRSGTSASARPTRSTCRSATVSSTSSSASSESCSSPTRCKPGRRPAASFATAAPISRPSGTGSRKTF